MHYCNWLWYLQAFAICSWFCRGQIVHWIPGQFFQDATIHYSRYFCILQQKVLGVLFVRIILKCPHFRHKHQFLILSGKTRANLIPKPNTQYFVLVNNSFEPATNSENQCNLGWVKIKSCYWELAAFSWNIRMVFGVCWISFAQPKHIIRVHGNWVCEPGTFVG